MRPFVVAVLVLCSHAAAGNGQAPDVSRILSTWKQREAGIRSGEYRWEQLMVVPKGSVNFVVPALRNKPPAPPADVNQKGECRLWFAGDKARFEYDDVQWSAEESSMKPQYSISAFNGSSFKRLYPVHAEYTHPYGMIFGPDDNPDMSNSALTPLLRAVRPINPLFQPIDLAKFTPTPELITINGRACVVLTRAKSASTEERLYLDAERSYNVVRLTQTRENVIIFKQDVYSWQVDPAGGWLPEKWDYVQRHNNGQLWASSSCKLLTAATNADVAPSTFEITFPKGTYVVDASKAERTAAVIDADGRPGTELSLVESPTYDKLNDLDNAARSQRRWQWALAAVTGVAIILIAGIVYKRRLRAPAPGPT